MISKELEYASIDLAGGLVFSSCCFGYDNTCIAYFMFFRQEDVKNKICIYNFEKKEEVLKFDNIETSLRTPWHFLGNQRLFA